VAPVLALYLAAIELLASLAQAFCSGMQPESGSGSTNYHWDGWVGHAARHPPAGLLVLFLPSFWPVYLHLVSQSKWVNTIPSTHALVDTQQRRVNDLNLIMNNVPHIHTIKSRKRQHKYHNKQSVGAVRHPLALQAILSAKMWHRPRARRRLKWGEVHWTKCSLKLR